MGTTQGLNGGGESREYQRSPRKVRQSPARGPLGLSSSSLQSHSGQLLLTVS